MSSDFRTHRLSNESGRATVSALVEALGKQRKGHTDLPQSRIVAGAFLTRRLRQEMTRLDADRSVATSLITCAEYQLFLDDQSASGHWFQPDHWVQERFPEGQGEQPITGVRPGDAVLFCNWLTHREPGVWHYRLPRHREFTSEHLNQLGVAALKDSKGYWSRAIETGGLNTWALIRDHNGPGRIDSASALFQNPINTLTQDRTSALYDARILAQDLAVTFVRTADVARTKAHDLSDHNDMVKDLARGSDLVKNLASIFDLSSPRTLATELPHALYEARQRTDVLDLAHTPTLARVNPSFHARSTANPVDFAGVLDFTLDRTIAQARARLIEGARARPSDMLTWGEAVFSLHWLIRFSALVVAEQVLWELEHSPAWVRRKRLFYPGGRRTQPDRLAKESMVKAYLDFYVQFTMLQARTQGTLQPFEGILIVKEKKRN